MTNQATNTIWLDTWPEMPRSHNALNRGSYTFHGRNPFTGLLVTVVYKLVNAEVK